MVAGCTSAAPRRRSPGAWIESLRPTEIAGLVVALAPIALFGMVGADARWLAAMGGIVTAERRIPAGIPFAALPTVAWHNVPVLGELVFHGLVALGGERALLAAQLAASALALGFVQRDARNGGASAGQTAAVVPLAVLTAAPAFLVVRAQLFSLALFPAVLLLLRSEARKPTRRIWLVPPLLALWANLHGAVLVGLAGFLAYVACERLRASRAESLALGVAGLASLLATPALLSTPAYFRGVMQNAAARRGIGLWAPLSPTSGWDLLLAAGALLLLVLALRARPYRFELLFGLLLAAMTAHAARSGVWLVLLAAVPAARAVPVRRPEAGGLRAMLLCGLGTLVVVTGLANGPQPIGAGASLVARAVRIAAGSPILAEDAAAEQVALAGGRVWAGDPIDAFPAPVQRRYVAWLRGEPQGDDLLEGSRIVLVLRGGPAERRLRELGGFRLVAADRRTDLFMRGRSSPP